MSRLFFILLVFISLGGYSNDPFVEDIKPGDFGPLIELETLVQSSPHLNAEDLKSSHPHLMENVLVDSDASIAYLFDDDTLGIAPFWWGFCLGIWGLVIVLILTDKDKSAVGQAFKGMLTCIGSVAVVWVILVLLGVTASLTI